MQQTPPPAMAFSCPPAVASSLTGERKHKKPVHTKRSTEDDHNIEKKEIATTVPSNVHHPQQTLDNLVRKNTTTTIEDESNHHGLHFPSSLGNEHSTRTTRKRTVCSSSVLDTTTNNIENLISSSTSTNSITRRTRGKKTTINNITTTAISSLPTTAGTRSMGATSTRSTTTTTNSTTRTERNEFISLAKSTDILLGRGKPFQDHPGNESMRRLVDQYKEQYNKLPRDKRGIITKEILQLLSKTGVRFLKRPMITATEDETNEENEDDCTNSSAGGEELRITMFGGDVGTNNKKSRLIPSICGRYQSSGDIKNSKQSVNRIGWELASPQEAHEKVCHALRAKSKRKVCTSSKKQQEVVSAEDAGCSAGDDGSDGAKKKKKKSASENDCKEYWNKTSNHIVPFLTPLPPEEQDDPDVYNNRISSSSPSSDEKGNISTFEEGGEEDSSALNDDWNRSINGESSSWETLTSQEVAKRAIHMALGKYLRHQK